VFELLIILTLLTVLTLASEAVDNDDDGAFGDVGVIEASFWQDVANKIMNSTNGRRMSFFMMTYLNGLRELLTKSELVSLVEISFI
jgi:hypothetical protein